MSEPVLEIRDLTVRLGGRTVLDDLDWTVEAGEFIGLIGPNGAGKTTLLRSVLGLIPRSSGSVLVRGMSPVRARGIVGYVPQKHHFAWDFPITVEDDVMSGRARRIGWLRRPGVGDWTAVERALVRADLAGLRTRPIGELSGGQRQRVLLARVLANDPSVLLLDEPFTGVDAPTQDMLTDLYLSLADEGIGIVMSTHDMLGAFDSCARLCGLRGNIALDAAPRETTLDEVNAWLRGRTLPARTADRTSA